MRIGPVAAILLVLCSCSVLTPTQRFEALGDSRTSQPKSLSESGRGRPIEMPPGITWVLAMDAIEESVLDRLPSRRIELTISLVDTQATDEHPRAQPILEGAELVDDSGNRFRCHRARVPDKAKLERRDPDEPSIADYALVFDLPPTYRFRSMTYFCVHWQLRLDDGRVLPISSRFRR